MTREGIQIVLMLVLAVLCGLLSRRLLGIEQSWTWRIVGGEF